MDGLYELDGKTEATCPKDKTPLRFYDGACGYEACYCPKCGYFEDHTSTGQDDFFKGLQK